jgi:hypothetical protein
MSNVMYADVPRECRSDPGLVAKGPERLENVLVDQPCSVQRDEEALLAAGW